MGDHDESIVLTDREREALAGLAESIGDPWLARQLAGGAAQAAPRRGPVARLSDRRVKLGVVAPWIGVLLVVAGAALALTTFVHSTVAASVGLVLMGVGLWRLVDHSGDAVIRRWNARRVPAAAPSTPHRRPGAA